MTFIKGKSGNPLGRPKGSGNKLAKKVKQGYADIVHSNIAQLKEDVNNMPPKERAAFLLHCSEFVLPKLARAKASQEQRQAFTGLRDWVINSIPAPDEHK